jgi:uncharacterized protein YukE
MPRTFRSTEELAAAALEKLRSLQIRQAKEQAQQDPHVASLFAARDEILREKRAAQVILGDGPQGAAARIKTHQDWIANIEQKAEDARRTLQNCESELAEIEAQIEQSVNAKIKTQI